MTSNEEPFAEFLDESKSQSQTLLMLAQELDYSVIVFEGEDDLLLLRKYVLEEQCGVVVFKGKPNVLKIASEYSNISHAPPILFIIDQDLDNFTSKNTPYPDNVIATENHDLFMDIFFERMSIAEDALLLNAKHLIQENKIFSINFAEIVHQSLSLAGHLAHARLAIENNDINTIPLRRKSLQSIKYPFTLHDICKFASNISQGSVTENQLIELVEAMQEPINLYSFIGDHDFIESLYCCAIQNGFPLKKFSHNQLESTLRGLILNPDLISNIKRLIQK
ncbi:hypothetical protein [Rothia amarae]|uniref:hypothetical protein n=1 Tax=Rothia amarae TaxID=169480 RepID=UPI0033F2B448